MAGKAFMLKLHLSQPGFTYRTCGPFTKHHKRIQKFKETGYLNYIYKNKLDKTCLGHDATYSDSKYLTKRAISDKVLKDRDYKIAINHKYNGYQRK